MKLYIINLIKSKKIEWKTLIFNQWPFLKLS